MGRDPRWGVNVVGYFRSELGVGEAARQVVGALETVGMPLLPLHGRTIPLNRQGHSFDYLDYTAARYPVNLICMNADALPEFAQQAGPSFFTGRYSIGLWFWEITTAPPGDWSTSFEYLDEVWVPTNHVAEAVTSVSPVPVIKVTIPIEMPPITPVSRATLGLRDDFLFLFSFDYLSVFRRKNPLAVVDAFTRAFDPGSGASLALKCINHEHDLPNHSRLVEAVAGHLDIQLIDSYLSPAQKDALTASCDCYVSLHRSEGFGLTIAEAMYLGKPVIATGYSGNLDFMTAANGYLVDYDLVSIGAGAEPYPADGVWAEPNVEHAAQLMREVFDDRGRSTARGALAAADVRRTHSSAAAGARMAARLESVRRLHRGSTHNRLVVPSLRPRIARGPLAPPRSGGRALGPLFRRIVLRLIRPFTAYQQTVNDEVLRSLEQLEQAVERLHEEPARSESESTARTRRGQDSVQQAPADAQLTDTESGRS